MKNLFTPLLFVFCSVIPSFGQNGTFWGATYNTYGGDGGRIYRFSGDGTNPVLIKECQQVDGDGAEPFETPLLLASDNKLYGGTRYGGMYQSGTLFSIDPVTFEFTKLHDFTFEPGDSGTPGPNGSLAEGSDGFLYGYQNYGSTLFKVKKDGTGYVKLTSDHMNTNYASGLIPGSDGELYGATETSSTSIGGVVFRLSTSGTRTTIATLPDGQGATGTLIKASNGKLYGCARHIGTFASIIFSCNNDGSDFQTVSIPDGTINRIVEGPGSKIYGTVSGLPSSKSGLFEIGLNGTGYSLFYQFESFREAVGPMVISGSTIYGTTRSETNPDDNLIYEYKIGSTGFHIITEIPAAMGSRPVGVTLGPDDYLFVVNQVDESSLGGGSVLKVKTNGDGFNVIKNFFIENDGSVLGMRMTQIPTGVMGVGAVGGQHTQGVIFKIDNNNQYQVLFNFDGDNNGGLPFDAPIPGPDNYYYGVTSEGGAHKLGVIYKIRADGSGYEKLFDFTNDSGNNPYGGLTPVDGRLYGMTGSGGTEGAGTIFGIDPDGPNFEKLLEFDGVNGGYPSFSVLVYNDGFLYGCTPEGGADSRGIVFKIRPDGSDFQIIFELTDVIGFSAPTSPFVKDDGDLLVVVGRGGSQDRGGIFSVKADGSEYELVHEFDVELPDANVVFNANLALGPDGLVWGVEPNGGANGTGSIFKMNADGSNYTTIDLDLDSNPIGYMMPWYGLLYTEDQGKIAQTITFPEPVAQTLGEGTLELNATASSGLPVTYSSDSDKISITDNVVTFLEAGRVEITAIQEGNETYDAAGPVERSFCINPAKPTITVGGTEAAPELTSSSDDVNQWYRDNVEIENGLGKTYEVTQDGLYGVKASVDDCSSFFSTGVSIALVLGIEDKELSAVNVYPNAAIGEVHLQIDDRYPARVNVIDVTGRVIETRIVSSGGDERFDIQSFSQGIYFFRVHLNDRVIIRRFMKL